MTLKQAWIHIVTCAREEVCISSLKSPWGTMGAFVGKDCSDISWRRIRGIIEAEAGENFKEK